MSQQNLSRADRNRLKKMQRDPGHRDQVRNIMGRSWGRSGWGSNTNMKRGDRWQTEMAEKHEARSTGKFLPRPTK